MLGKASLNVSAAFGALKTHRAQRQANERNESLALGQLGEFIQRKVFRILARNAEERKRLQLLYEHLQARTNELLMARCVREMISSYVV